MKRIILSLSIIALVFSSCGKKELQDQLITQQKLNDSIQAVIKAKDAELEELFQELNSIEQSLSDVTSKYSNVNKLKNTSGEKITKNTRERITSEIQNINELLASNKQKLSKLSKQVSGQGDKNKELVTFVENLQKQLNDQEAQIQALTSELQEKKIVIENLNKNLSDLSKQNQEKDQQILQVETEKNTAYYIVGTKKELQEQGIVNVKGGFLGIGRKTNVNNDSELSKYTKVDIRHFDLITLNGEDKIKIMTTHPSTSYTIEGTAKKPTGIKITDPSKFWGKSKFLIIMYE
ncbi:MAG: hypothetical protein LBM25_01025 [Bacteroidales bacterium]|jgi:chromosome segregation ATPase|nr:hypothetical protein [Bacteroidales bacterium]